MELEYQSRVGKHGHSLYLLLPSKLVRNTDLKEDAKVQMQVTNSKTFVVKIVTDPLQTNRAGKRVISIGNKEK